MTTNAEFSWSALLRQLLVGESLTTQATTWAMNAVMDGTATSAQIAAFVVALRAKGETASEVRGFVDAMLAHAGQPEISTPTLDIVGTGGDLSHSVNISTMSAIVAAAAGAPVAKHGNRAATSRSGSADVLEALGVAIDLAPEHVATVLDKVGITFLFAPVFHSSMRFAAAPRKEIGVPTVFNILGPLANPARPAAMLVGCADVRLAPVMAQVLASFNVRALVVRGADGLDEVTTADVTQVWDVRGSQVVECVLDAQNFGIARESEQALRGGDADYNAAIARSVISGERSSSLDPVRDAVVLNAGAALAAYAALDAPADDLNAAVAAGVQRARTAIDSGAARHLLDGWIAASQAARP